ncbi:MAG: type VI secretion system lipoprotein TssJ [Enterobacteriaceae bacterium]
MQTTPQRRLLLMRVLAISVLTGALLTGCGLTQKVTDGTVSLSKSIFYKEIKTLHLDFQARSTINTDSNQAALATVVRVYQLRHGDVFFRTGYDDLVEQDHTVLHQDLLRVDSTTLLPNGNAILDVPLHAETRFIGVVGLFRSPDIRTGGWRMLITREALLPNTPRVVEVGNGSLALKPIAK